MDCGLDRDILQEGIDGTLGRLEDMLLGAHLRSCESCRNEYKEMANVFRWIKGLEGFDDMPDGLYFLRNQALNKIDGLKRDHLVGLKKVIKVRDAVIQGADRLKKIVPGSDYIEKVIKKAPKAIYRTVDFLIKKGMGLAGGRGKA